MKNLRKDAFISLVDQAFLSLASFLIGIFLIKNSSKADYGLYVLAYSVILLVVSAQNALVTNQMTVLMPKKPRQRQLEFCAALGAGQYIIAVPLALFGASLVLLLGHFNVIENNSRDIFLATIISVLPILMREFFRVFFFLKLTPVMVMKIDAIHITFLFTFLLLAKMYFPDHLHIAAVLSIGLGSFFSGFFALRVSDTLLKTHLDEIFSALSEAWINGKWALIGVTVTWLDSQSYVYLLTAMSSLEATAEVNAARIFLMPVALLNTSLIKVLLPRWVFLRQEHDIPRIFATARKVLILFICAIACYVFVLMLFKEQAIKLFLTNDYSNVGVLILLWGVLFAIQAFRGNYSILLQVFERFRAITLSSMVSATVVVLLSIILIHRYGAIGSVMAMIMGELTLAFLLARSLNGISERR